jgi:RimJ/RimL family protein N-acetyltransferase
MMPGDTIETERLVLRRHGLEDAAASAALWADPEVTRFIGGRPSTAEEAWARLLRYAGHWALLGFGYWVVQDRATGRLIGEAGFADFRRGVGPRFDGVPEIGWALAPSAQGRGLAREAVQAALAWADARPGAGRTVCMIAPENPRSIRLAEACGYREFGTTFYKEQPTILFER